MDKIWRHGSPTYTDESIAEHIERNRHEESGYPKLMGGNDHWESPRSKRTALEYNSHLGWAEIRHPYHPLRGQQFRVLKQRRVAGIDTLLLRECERGSFSVAREWTDWADPCPYAALGLPARRLDAGSLFELVTLLEQLNRSEQKG